MYFPEVKYSLLKSSGFPHSSVGKSSACNAEVVGSILGSRRPPEEGDGDPLQYSCLENPKDRGAWQTTVHGISRVGHNSATKPPPKPLKNRKATLTLILKIPSFDA